METKNITLFAYRMQRDMAWVRANVGEMASRSEVIVKSIDEVPRIESGTRKGFLSRKMVPYSDTVAYDYYAVVMGEPENVERFRWMAKGFIFGYNSRVINH